MISLVNKKEHLRRQLRLFFSRRHHLSPRLIFGFIISSSIIIISILPASYPPAQPLIRVLPTSFPTPTSIPIPASRNLPVPPVSARYIFIMDRNTKSVLYNLQSDITVSPASTTKMMTALVSLENYSLDQTLPVNRTYKDGQVVGFQLGEHPSVEQLIYALLVESGNDAAEILADNFPGGRQGFISAMNAKAAQLYLLHTHFSNPTGLDEVYHYSSASDLARLADYAMNKPEFAKVVGTENAVLPGNRVLTNLNQLLGRVPGVMGIKTGFTDEAGQALVTLVDQQNHPVILVVLKSTDRFADTESLISWVYSNFTWPN